MCTDGQFRKAKCVYFSTAVDSITASLKLPSQVKYLENILFIFSWINERRNKSNFSMYDLPTKY